MQKIVWRFSPVFEMAQNQNLILKESKFMKFGGSKIQFRSNGRFWNFTTPMHFDRPLCLILEIKKSLKSNHFIFTFPNLSSQHRQHRL